MNNNIYILGACETTHFNFFKKQGFENFIVDNSPGSFKFVPMKIMKRIIEKYNIVNFILTKFPNSKEEFDYYKMEFSQLGIELKFLEDFESLEIPFHHFKINSNLPKNKIILLNTDNYFIDDRTFDSIHLEKRQGL